MTAPSERRVVLLIAAVQLVNILDFMMVMPLGPDFAADLSIPTSQIGFVAGAYTGAAAIAGALGTYIFDRVDRRRALLVALLGLTVGTAAGTLATGLGTLVAARAVAGLFGGPATSLSYAALADAVPIERRGRAMGLVMSAFAVASVVGVPLGLELARLGSWRTPFVAVAGLCLLVTIAAALVLPPAPPQERPEVGTRSTWALLTDPRVALAMSAMGISMAAHFAVVSNMSTWMLHNVGIPREQLGGLYLVGGLAAFAVLQVSGRLVDRYGAPLVVVAGSALLFVVFAIGFLPPLPLVPVAALFVGMMCGASIRNVAMNALSTKVPAPDERGRYMSLQSTTQHVSSSVGAFGAAALLTEQPDGALVGMPVVASLSMVGIAVVPLLIASLAARLRAS
jgi:predicted MFS family arabinose efflux permease